CLRPCDAHCAAKTRHSATAVKTSRYSDHTFRYKQPFSWLLGERWFMTAFCIKFWPRRKYVNAGRKVQREGGDRRSVEKCSTLGQTSRSVARITPGWGDLGNRREGRGCIPTWTNGQRFAAASWSTARASGASSGSSSCTGRHSRRFSSTP